MSTSATNNTSNVLPALQVKKLRAEAVLPTRGSEWSAGYDLSSAESKTIAPGARAVVKTALSIACPAGTYGRIAPRSGLTVKKGIHVGAGVVDADYRGEVGVVLFNLGQEDFEIQPGDRIAQLVLEQILMVPVQEVQELDETVRGAGGFGSTGVAATTEAKRARVDAPSTVSPTDSGEEMTNQ
jgi:dUTP pyrophosphatase